MLDVNIQRVFRHHFALLVVRQNLLNDVVEEVYIASSVLLDRFSQRFVVSCQVNCDVDLLAMRQVSQL